MKKKIERCFTANKDIRLVAQNFNPRSGEIEIIVEIEDRGETRLFRKWFDIEEVCISGEELITK